jgi:monofunctional biosynthetic peptidoglycan transglycosylase
VRIELSGGPVSLASLGVRENDFGLVSVGQALLEARASLTLSADAETASFAGAGKLDQLSLNRPELASGVLSGIRVAFRGTGNARLDGSVLSISEAEVGLGDVRMLAHGSYERDPNFTNMDLSAQVPLAACQTMFDAVPKAMIPVINGVRLSGTFALNANVVFDSRKPDAGRVRLDVRNDCRVAEIPTNIDPARFRNSWSREVPGPAGSTLRIESGPGSPDWVPYEDISPYMETAIVVCEDAGFLHHHGFDYRAIENSIRDNLRAGRFLRGASTASMQLAKNLYLRKEKTLGRKLQEAVLTTLLEQELTKQELLELYLNVIEFGPGIYGIGPAARHYFNKPARELSLGQALYLASILPSPDRKHFDAEGKLHSGWMNYLTKLMGIAHKIRRISDEELERGLNESLVFGVADVGSAATPVNDQASEPDDSPPEL